MSHPLLIVECLESLPAFTESFALSRTANRFNRFIDTATKYLLCFSITVYGSEERIARGGL